MCSGMLVGEELVDKVSDAVLSKLVPKLDELIKFNNSGVLIGGPRIKEYMGSRFTNKRSGAIRCDLGVLKGWYANLGFPLSKNTRGKWWITKTMIDKWLYERSVLMLKMAELGYRLPNRRSKGGGEKYFPPERGEMKWIEHARREILKDRLKRKMGGVE